MDDAILTCTNLTKVFERSVIPSVMFQDKVLRWRAHRERWSVHALENVSLALQRGEWLGLYGHNGSGKTTLMRILASLMEPDSGSVEIRGTMSCFFDLGVGFHLERTAEENISFHQLLHGVPRSAIRERTEAIVAFSGIGSHRDLPLKCYSTGMKLRLAFAAVAHIDADIYLFDEILAVGDQAFQDQCWAHLRTMKAQGKSVILVNHGLGDLRDICDRIVFLEHGCVKGMEMVENNAVSPHGVGTLA